MNKKYSFKEFLTEEVELIGDTDTSSTARIDIIAIPMIQRDYAQGRKERSGNNGESALNTTGQLFIRDIFSAIMSDDPKKQLELDFIYGSIEQDKDDKKYFSPLDGQQRLTTLFLLYWFIGGTELEATEKEELAGILKNFSYKTRTSSKEFCKEIVEELKKTRIEYLPGENADKDKKETELKITISTQIENSPWFHNSHKLDPTVQSMLNMLDEIQRLYIEGNCKNLYKRLENLRFYVLPLTSFNLTEDLYVKMNARGKQLTDFENFKADLQKWIKDHAKNLGLAEQEYRNRKMPYDLFFLNKIDNEWSQRFWEKAQKDGEPKNFESLFLSFIYKYFLNEYILNFTGSNEQLDKEPDFSPLAEEKKYSGISLFKKLFSKKSLENLVTLLDIITDHYDDILEVSSPCWAESATDSAERFDILGEKQNLKKRTVFCAIVLYLTKKDFDKETLKNWVHIVWNIVENADIDSWRVAAGVIQLVNELSEYSDDIYGLLVDDTKCSAIKSAQSKETMKEERKKAKLIRKDSEWADKLLRAEEHPFFKGCVSFLIPSDENIHGFEHNLEMANVFFDKEGVSRPYREEDHIFLRALLSRYRYLHYVNEKGKIKEVTQYKITDHYEGKDSLKKMLRSDSTVRAAISEWFSLETEEDIHKKLIDETQKDSPIDVKENDFDRTLHENLYKKTDLINWMWENECFRYEGDFVLKAGGWKRIYVKGHRNEIITKLIKRDWTCKNLCFINEGKIDEKQIPFYWSRSSGEINVEKTVNANGDEVTLKCEFGCKEVSLFCNDNEVASFDYIEEVPFAQNVDSFVDTIIKKFEEHLNAS